MDIEKNCSTCNYNGFAARCETCHDDYNEWTPLEQTIRQFGTGATRDTVEGKLNYIKALCPLVLEQYVQYLSKHRLQSDGNLRDWDNWKKGIPKDTYLESLFRHVHAVWMLNEGHPVQDSRGNVDIKDALCGVIFNAMGMLHEILKDRMI